ncbi:MAG: aminotransferase class I/II-fold pyridoxal phosphate-dependent enzyme [Clostridiales bacterium]|nr:aminotransferase class I/II-fold pyridoxal phosphate-dependent enzyme [Clostridiales bacterium]
MYQHGGDLYTNKNVIDFSANINFLGMPESSRRAAQEAVRDAIHYPDSRCGEFREAVAGMEGVPADTIFCGNGAADVIFSLVRAVNPQRGLLPVPSFYEYRKALCAAGCEVITYPLREENEFCLREDILERITPDIRILILCNPNNPTGILTERKLLERIFRRCETTGTLLVTDECFLDLTAEPERFSMMPLTADSDRLFILKAFTKTFAMPGLRIGYGVCRDRSLLRRMEEVSPPWRVSVPAQAAGIAAAHLARCGKEQPPEASVCGEMDYLGASRQAIRENREELSAGLRKLGYTVWDSAANFVFFRGEPGLAELLCEQGILIRDCGNFEGLGDGYYRAAVRSKYENEMLLRAMGNLLNEDPLI